jgi:hypothetical protein
VVAKAYGLASRQEPASVGRMPWRERGGPATRLARSGLAISVRRTELSWAQGTALFPHPGDLPRTGIIGREPSVEDRTRTGDADSVLALHERPTLFVPCRVR